MMGAMTEEDLGKIAAIRLIMGEDTLEGDIGRALRLLCRLHRSADVLGPALSGILSNDVKAAMYQFDTMTRERGIVEAYKWAGWEYDKIKKMYAPTEKMMAWSRAKIYELGGEP